MRPKLFLVCMALLGTMLACGPYYLEKATLCDDLAAPIVESNNAVIEERLNPLATSLSSPVTESFKTAVITFDLQHICFENEHGTGIKAGCWPPDPNGYFAVASDGTLDGQCASDEYRDDQLVSTNQGVLSGRYDAQTGIVTFHLEGTTTNEASVGDGNSHVTVTFDGAGNSTSSGVVTGTATFSYSCETEGWGISCGNGFSLLETRGAVPFTIQFSP